MNENDPYQPNQPHPIAEPLGGLHDSIEAQIVKTNHDSDPQPLSISGWMSWLVVAGLCCFVLSMVTFNGRAKEHETAPETSSAELAQVELQGKILIAMKQFMHSMDAAQTAVTNEPASEKSAANQASENSVDAVDKDGADNSKSAETEFSDAAKQLLTDELDVGPYFQRLCYAILVNEVKGPAAALEQLKSTDQRVAEIKLNLVDDAGKSKKFKLTEDQTKIRSILERMFDNYVAGDFSNETIPPADKQLLQKKLGWYAELAFVPPQTADEAGRKQVIGAATSTILRLAIAAGFALLAALAGFIVAIVLVVLAASGKLRSRIQHKTSRHNVYIETFAIWMAILIVGPIPFSILINAIVGNHGEMTQLIFSPIFTFGSLFVLVWPVFRGVSFAEVREDIGWKIGNPFVEAGSGVVGYLSVMPMLIVAIILVGLLIANFGPQQSPTDFANRGGPSHPVQEYLAEGNLAVFGLVLILACVSAPIVEETMFRGVLYRHLRDLTAGHRMGISIAISCLINSFVFASIHPQGIFGIPLLMALAIGFSLAREWRGSLLAPMLMHALSNFLVTSLAFFIM